MFKRTRDYAKDYQIVEKEGNKPGKVKKEVVYKGKYYSFNLTDSERLKMKGAYGALMLLAISLYGFMGLTGTGALGAGGAQAAFYVLLPYVIALLPLGMCVAKTIMLIFGPEKMEYGQYDKNVVMLKSYSIFLAVCGGVTLAGEIVYTFVTEGASLDISTSDGLFALLALIFILVASSFTKLQSTYKCTAIR